MRPRGKAFAKRERGERLIWFALACWFLAALALGCIVGCVSARADRMAERMIQERRQELRARMGPPAVNLKPRLDVLTERAPSLDRAGRSGG